MAQLFSNNAIASLASGVTAGATSITLGTGEGAQFTSPTGGDYELITVYDGVDIGSSSNIEIMQVTARSSDTLTVVRAQEGTTGFAFSSGAGVEACNTAGTMDRIKTDIKMLSLFGAVGDGVTLDQTSVDDALADGVKSVRINDGFKSLVTTLDNELGRFLTGDGAIVKSITGGLQKLNTYTDDYKYIVGREYLAAYHKLLITQTDTPTRAPIVVFSGDSTTAGDSADTDYHVDQLFLRHVKTSGLQTPYGTSVVNNGVPGAHTGQWETTHVTTDLAASPDLLVLRWGINDPGWLKSGSAAPIDAGQDYPDRRDLADFITSLRNGLTTIRASRAVSSLSIVLMTPNSTSDTPNARDELWYEEIAEAIKVAARDFQCCFIDTYAWLKDSRGAANIWMDDPFADGRSIHPLNVMNTWIMSLLCDVVLPSDLQSKIANNKIRVTAGAEDVGDSTDLPATYETGIEIRRALDPGTAFPADGNTITFRSADDTIFQILYPYRDADRGRFYYRFGRSAVLLSEAANWSSWVSSAVSSTEANVTPAPGYSIPVVGQGRAVKQGNQIICEGYIIKDSPSIVPANTSVGSLPVGFRPISEAIYWDAVIWNGSTFASTIMRVQPDGNIATAIDTPISMTRVWLNVGFSDLT